MYGCHGFDSRPEAVVIFCRVSQIILEYWDSTLNRNKPLISAPFLINQ
jgi:hypothetical protein